MQRLLFDEFPAQPGDFVIEKMVRQSNLLAAYQRVKRNGGAPCVDGVTVSEFGKRIQSELLRATTIGDNGNALRPDFANWSGEVLTSSARANRLEMDEAPGGVQEPRI